MASRSAASAGHTSTCTEFAALRAATAIGDVDVFDDVAVLLAAREFELLDAGRPDVEERAAIGAHEVVVTSVDVGVVAGGAIADSELENLAHVDQLAECVVHGRQRNLRQANPAS